jgi:hypothetical protein
MLPSHAGAHLPAACLHSQILTIEPQEHFRHAVVAVRQYVCEILAASDCVLRNTHACCHGAGARNLQMSWVATAAVAFAVEVQAVTAGGGETGEGHCGEQEFQDVVCADARMIDGTILFMSLDGVLPLLPPSTSSSSSSSSSFTTATTTYMLRPFIRSHHVMSCRAFKSHLFAN